jgi:hypothetical protein
MVGSVPRGQRGRPNTTKLRNAQNALYQALVNQYNLRTRYEVAKAAGFNFPNYNNLKKQANNRINNAKAKLIAAQGLNRN